MALIPPQYLDTVVAIGVLNMVENKPQSNWVGTGFLVGDLVKINPDNSNEKSYRIFLVTNKHVIGNLRSLIIRFNPQTDQPATDFPAPLYDNTGKALWYGHPKPNVDVAVVPINITLIEQHGMKFSFFAIDQHFYSSDELSAIDTLEGDFIYIMGFPMGLVAKERQHVIVRSGIISRIRDLFEKRSTDFVVDAMVFPGNSGGPVINKPEIVSMPGTQANKTCKLIGIVKSYIPYQEVAISQQTKRPRMVFEENSGLSIVEPTEHIVETIKVAKEDEEKTRQNRVG